MNTQEKIETLTNQIPTTLQGDYVIIFDQINATTFALAKRNPEYSNSSNLGHEPITDFRNYKEMQSFLRGMQVMIKLIRVNKMKF